MDERSALDLELPYPLPFSKEFDDIGDFKGKQWNLFAQKTKIGIPSSVGALIVFLFLDIKDIVKLAFTSKHMLSIAVEALRFKEHWEFRNFQEFSFQKFDKLLTLVSQPMSITSLFIKQCPKSLQNLTLNTTFVSLLSKIVKLKILKSCSEAELAAILTRCKSLRELETDRMSDDGVFALQNGLLTSLKLIECETMTLEGISSLYLKFNLNEGKVSLSFIDLEITGVGYVRLASALEIEVEEKLDLAIEIIDCKHFNDETADQCFAIIAQNYLIQVTSIILRNLPLASSVLNKLRNLRVLDVQYLDFKNTQQVFKLLKNSEKSLKQVSIRNPQNLKLINISSLFNCQFLVTLNLAHCSSIVDDNFLNLLSAKTRNLENINLDSCHNISNKGLKYLCRGCNNLSEINLSRCELIDNSGIEEIVIFIGKRVTALNLSGCYRVTSIGVTRIALTCSNLKVFDVSWCFQVGKDALCQVAENCRKLETLKFEGLSQISDFERDTIYQLSYKLQKEVKKNLIRQRSAPKVRTRKPRSLSMIPKKDLGFISTSMENRNTLNRRSSTIEIKESFSIDDGSLIIEQDEIEARSSLFKLT